MKKVAVIAGTVLATSLIGTAHADAQTHTVKSGESLWSIADKYNTTIEKIQKINKLDSTLITPDQKLEVLVNGKYKVEQGDTLKKIAKKFDVTVKQLKKLNDIDSDKDLKVGDMIKVEKVASSNTAPATQTVDAAVKAPVVQTETKTAEQAPATTEAATTEAPKAAVQQTSYKAPVQKTQQTQPVQQAQPAAQTQSSAAPASNSSMDAHLKVIAQRESGGNPSAVNPAGYYGLFQFSPATWAAVGGTGNPANASVEEQWKRARILYSTAGASQWSTAY